MPDSHDAPAGLGRAAKAGAEIVVQDFARTGPGTLAGGYLRTFWQPVYRGVDLPPGRVLPVTIMSEEFALYRGEDGSARLVEARCAHRGAKLSVGWVEGNDIKCAYHAWAYNGATGVCTKQPAEPRPFCDKVSIRAYPVKEYLGLVFAYLGEGKPPEFERFPEFEYSDYFVDLTTNTWNCNYWAQLENALDIAHTEFLHWHFHFKTPQRTMIEEVPFGVKGYSPGLSGVADYYDTVYFHMPNTHEWVSPPVPGEKVGFYAKSWRIPRDDGSHIRFDLKVVPLKGDDKAAYATREAERKERSIKHLINAYADDIVGGRTDFRTIKAENTVKGSDLVNVQDCTVMTSLEPLASREWHEMLGQTDLGIVMLRRLWKQELQAFAAGRPLRQWRRAENLWAEMRT